MSKRPSLYDAEFPEAKRRRVANAAWQAERGVDPLAPIDSNATYGVNQGLISSISAVGQAEWLRRSQYWKGLDPNVWKPKKVLGMGGAGCCGLWERVTADSDHDILPKQIVIKQSGQPDTMMMWESKFLREIMASCDTTHVVKIYRAYHEDGGTGTFEYDPFPLDEGVYRKDYTWRGFIWNFARVEIWKAIQRSWLRRCTISFDDFIKRAIGFAWMFLASFKNEDTMPPFIPEEYLWRTLECLARGLMVFEHGREDPALGESWSEPIAHFDMNPGNVLLGVYGEEDKKLRAFKFADLGQSMRVPKTKSTAWLEAARFMGAQNYLPPEIYFSTSDPPSTKVRVETNVWGVGCLLHEIIAGNGHIDPTKPISIVNPLGSSNRMKTYGVNFMLQRLPYSQTLLELIMECFAFTPGERPEAAVILQRSSEILQINDGMNTIPYQPDEPLDPNSSKSPDPNIPPAGHPPFVVPEEKDYHLPPLETHNRWKGSSDVDLDRPMPPADAFDAFLLPFRPNKGRGPLNPGQWPWKENIEQAHRSRVMGI